MAAPNAKPERNAEIKALWKGGMFQKDIGAIYGLSQFRVSAIIHDKLPMYHYCGVCRIRLQNLLTICEPCRASRKAARAEKKRLKEEGHEFLRRERQQRAQSIVQTRKMQALAVAASKLLEEIKLGKWELV